MKIRSTARLATICLAVALGACPVLAESVLTVRSPAERHVVQRNQRNQADVPIAVTLHGDVDLIEARADLTPEAKRGTPVGWTVLARGDGMAKGQIAGKLTLDAGGWYVVSLRALHGQEVVAEARVTKVGVGDVFVTAGQSNSANYGKPRQAARDDRVVYFDGNGFVPARDPIPGGCGSNGSLWPLLGDLLVESQQVPVCFRSASQTWTEVKNWMPGVAFGKFHLYENLVQSVQAFGKSGVRAVLWHQGESDALARTSAETYYSRLKTVIESLDKDAGYEIPWFVAQASFHPGSKEPEEKQVAGGQQLLWKKGIARQGPVTDDLLGKEYRHDGVHFNQLGLTTHAQRWFAALTAEYGAETSASEHRKIAAALRLAHSGAIAQEKDDANAAPAETKAAAQSKLAIELGRPFGDNAVFQQQIPVPVWGSSQPGAKITIICGSQTKATLADKDGKWKTTLDPMPADKLTSVSEAPQGRSLTVVAELAGEKATNTLRNILIGEVWLCAGQSNMAGKLGGGAGRPLPDGSILTGNYPALRQSVAPSSEPWLVCTPETVGQFKKVCFYFARRLQQDIRVPVGIINAAVGGSRIETWLNQAPCDTGQNYRALIAPLVGYGLRGAVWYQGESNEKDGRAYLPKLRSLILGWRDVWGEGDLPFYFVQLPGIGTSRGDNPAGGDGRAEIRQAQFEALAVANTGMAVTIDVGDVKEHPPNKYDTGVRLARLALHNDYGFKSLVPTGPLYKGHRVEGDKIRVYFSSAEHGLMLAEKTGFQPPVETADAKLKWLSLRGEDGVWHGADGTIAGSDLVVSCADVKRPVAVRYGYTTRPTGSLLYNKDGLPASPFSTCGY